MMKISVEGHDVTREKDAWRSSYSVINIINIREDYTNIVLCFEVLLRCLHVSL